jgi:hypothetical protein
MPPEKKAPAGMRPHSGLMLFDDGASVSATPVLQVDRARRRSKNDSV